MKKWTILGLVPLAVALAATEARAGAGCCAALPATRSAAEAETYVAVLRVTGRTCHSCDRAVKAALARVQGVRSVRLDSETVTVVAERNLSERRLLEAVEAAGGDRHAFGAEVVSCRGHGAACSLRRRGAGR